MKLLVGLGNPGREYSRNRHNIGFMVLDEIAKAHNFAPWRSRFKGETCEGLIEGEKCLLLKPQTFMNLSGEAVQKATSFYKIEPFDTIVFHDEIDLPPAKIKVKTDGGNAGHNGLKSISQHIGNGYVRVRLGVGRPQQKAQVANFVLKDFAKDDADWLEDMLRSIGRHIGLLSQERKSDFLKNISDDLRPFDPKPLAKAPKATEKAKKITNKQAVAHKDNAFSGNKDKSGVLADKDSSENTENTKKLNPKTAQIKDRSSLGAALDKWLKKGD